MEKRGGSRASARHEMNKTGKGLKLSDAIVIMLFIAFLLGGGYYSLRALQNLSAMDFGKTDMTVELQQWEKLLANRINDAVDNLKAKTEELTTPAVPAATPATSGLKESVKKAELKNIKLYEAGKEIELKQELTLTNGSKWYRTEYSANKEIGNGFRAEDVEEVKAPEKSNITQIPQMKSEEKSLESEKMNSNPSLDSKSILPDSSSGTNDNVDKNSSRKITEEDMSNIKKIEDESAAISSAVEFSPVIPEQVKLKTYFTTGSLLIATTLASSIAIALIPNNAILIMAIAGALNTAYASVNQLFKISSKK